MVVSSCARESQCCVLLTVQFTDNMAGRACAAAETKKIAVGFLVRRYSNAVSVRRMFDQFDSQETIFNAS
jgi:hypothetical protein